MVEGMSELQSTDEGICRGCALGRNVKKRVSSNNNRSKEILDLIHSDVCVLMPVKSLGGSLYYLRKTCCISLRQRMKFSTSFKNSK
jgi:hypothetical protein